MSPAVVEVLIIENHKSTREDIRRAFEVHTSPNYTFAITEVETKDEYERLKNKGRFDVVVVDLHFPGKKELGDDAILAIHKRLFPDSIIIVCTGFPRGDKIRTCVRVMKLGAADCIEKDGGPAPYAQVAKSAIDELESRRTSGYGPSSEWLAQNIEQLIAKYGGKAIALVGNEVKAEADSASLLREHLAAHPMTGVPYIMAVPSSEEWI